ncbi:alpha-2-macroglobulin family protein [Flammeovirga pectinis]|uniref:Alpha-2-macroglobulin family protein n=1 Tax=Flammeovirga pectinis TaxID=2494373 RepID=A0A3S9P7L0_9BACT|nr:MG2 domain-containing protein [Flammeovirga pectinis]AZQ64205.1 alpha-2-macroglobulin family protein [Flammeovirga pectinis]
MRFITQCQLLFLFVLFSGCSSDQASKIIYKNFTDEVEVKQNLSFTFSSETREAKSDEWINTPYLTISPEVNGKFRWSAKNTLVFSPEVGFKPSTKYVLQFSSSELSKEGIILSSDQQTYSFKTPVLKVINKQVTWALGKHNKPVPHISFEFNYPVDSEELSKLLKFKEGAQSLKFEKNSNSINHKVVYTLLDYNSEKDTSIKLSINKGLNTKNGSISMPSYESELIVPKKQKFAISSVEAKTTAGSNVILINTNQGVYREKNIKSLIKVSPKVTFEVEEKENGIKLVGDFRSGQDYNVRIAAKLKGVFRTPLGKEYKENVVFGELTPSISFVDKKSIYLSNKGKKEIDLSIVNVPEIDIKIFKIYKNNLLSFFDNNSNYQESDYYYYGPQYYKLGDEVFSRSKVSVRDLETVGINQVLSLDFLDENKFEGVYVIELRSSEKRYLAVHKLLSISDIGLIVKEGKNSALVYANSIADASALSGVEVTLVSRNNQEVYTQKTGSDGIAKFEDLAKNAKGFDIKMVYAKNGSDFNYINYDQTRISTARFNVGGLRLNSTGMMTYIYGDRNLYRPGETVYFKTVTRDNNWNPAPNQPIKVKVYLPDGNELISRRATLNAQGTYEGSVKLMDAGVTGAYRIEVSTANDIVLASHKISVEDFMPDRIKVETQTSKKQIGNNDSFTLNGKAVNLFGPPASNRNYEVDLSLSRKSILPKNYEEYNFTLNGRVDLSYLDHLRQGKTDTEGLFKEEFSIDDKYENSGLLEAKIYTTVFDESGRPVRRLAKIEIPTQQYFIGIKDDDWYVKTKSKIKLPIIAVNKEMKVANNAKVIVNLIRYEWQSVMESTYNGRYRYVSRKKAIPVSTKTINISGEKAYFSFVPEISGEYEVQIKVPDASNYVTKRYYAYGWGETTNSAFEVDKEGRVTIEPEKTVYNIGDKAKILFKTPFKGKMLVTIEQDEVVSYQIVNTDNKSASIEIPIQEEHLPNIFITATLIKGAKDNALPLTVAHGFVPLKVTSPKRKIDLRIEAPKESRSRKSQTIEVTSGNGEEDIEVTVAVVDEGILQIKNYITPNPFNFFYQNRALNVDTYNIYPKMMQFKQQANSFGSDMANLGARANPMINNRVNLVAYWSGTLKTDNDGKVKFTVNIPEFSGELRVMAVAVKGNAFGTAEMKMKVKDPLVISTSLPRFLSPKDKNEASIMLANTTDKPVDVKTSLAINGALSVEDTQLETVEIPANSEKMINFTLLADNTIGTGKVTVIANALNEDFISETNINVRPSTSLLKSNGENVIQANQSKSIDLKEDYIKSSIKGKLWLSKSPMMQFAKSLNYLIRYPYGCVEQTTSAVFPQLYLGDLANTLNKGIHSNKSDFYINEAIRKLQSMQMYNGGLSYWQGGSYVSYYGSAYATHFLLEAKNKGYEVDRKVLNKLLDYLQKNVKKKNKETYTYYNSRNERTTRTYADKTTFYALYILAEAGKADIPTMNYYKKNSALVPKDSKYVLAASYLRVGDQKSYRLLLPKSFGVSKSETEFGGSFSSFIRDQALALNVLLSTDPKNAQIGVLSKELTESMKSKEWMSTQERAFGLLALGKLAQKASAQNVKAVILADGNKVAEFDNEDLSLTKEVLGKEIDIKVTGNGQLYYFWEIEGLNASGNYPEEDKKLKVRRTYYNRDGKAISTSSFKQNDLIIVGITLQTDGRNVENVVVTDMLPAGFEIENPRLGDVPGMGWTKSKASIPQHVDFRDDRVHFFTTANKKMKTYFYVVRAVSKGTFKVGPVSADAMYNGAYHSYNGARTIVVE